MKEHLDNIKEGAIILGALVCFLALIVLVFGLFVAAFRFGGWWTMGALPAIAATCWFVGMINRSAEW